MSAKVLPFIHHARAPSDDLKAKTEGSASRSRFSNSLVIIRKFSGGIVPRARQLLTAERLKPTKSAAAPVPPKASMISSTDLSMPHDSSRTVKMSRVHGGGMDYDRNVNFNNRMDSKHLIAERFDRWLRVKKHREGLTVTLLCDIIGTTETQISNYRRADRPLDIEVADALCQYGLTLDWLYRGDPRSIDYTLLADIQNIDELEQTTQPAKLQRRSRYQRKKHPRKAS